MRPETTEQAFDWLDTSVCGDAARNPAQLVHCRERLGAALLGCDGACLKRCGRLGDLVFRSLYSTAERGSDASRTRTIIAAAALVSLRVGVDHVGQASSVGHQALARSHLGRAVAAVDHVGQRTNLVRPV